MPEFIKPITDTLLSILEARTPALLAAKELEAFVDYGRQFTGVVMNFPSVFVRPVRTQFDPDAPHTRRQRHHLRLLIAVADADPEALATAALGYVAAVDDAIAASDPGDWTAALAGGEVLAVTVAEHDYGPMFEREAGYGRLPVIDVLVDVEETL